MLGSLSLGLTGCGRIESARECQALVAIVNPELDAIEAGQDAGTDQRAALLDAASRYNHLATRVARLEFKNEEIGKVVKEYSEVLRRAAQVTRGLANSLGPGQLPALTRAQAEMAAVSKREKVLSRRLDKLCHDP